MTQMTRPDDVPAAFQAALLVRGQTWSEFQRGSRPFDLGSPAANIRALLGPFAAGLLWAPAAAVAAAPQDGRSAK